MDKVRENKARRYAKRQGLILRKGRARLPNVNDLGGYMLVDLQTNRVEAGQRFDLTLEEVEKYLAEGDEELTKSRK